MPGFIDSHSHIVAFAQTLGFVNLSGCKNIQEIIEKVKHQKNSQKVENGKWIVGLDMILFIKRKKTSYQFGIR